MKFKEQFPNLEIKEQVPLKLEDLRYSMWTMERLLEDIQKQCLDKSVVEKAIDELEDGYGSSQCINFGEDLKKKLGIALTMEKNK